MKVDRKIRVFISSKCGGQYTVARKALKVLLEELGICEVYAFETDYSSSVPVVSLYLAELSFSDVVIVFIDNKDGVTDPVQSEINRARELKKKMLFFFCDEYVRKATVLQEQLKEGYREKYDLCHEFSEFPEKAYNAFINDVTRQYRYFAESLSNDITGAEEEQKSVSEAPFIVNKKNIKNIGCVKASLARISGIYFAENTEVSDIDRAMGDLFQVLIGEKRIADISVNIIGDYWHENFTDRFSKVVETRKDAFTSFLSGRYKDALDNLNGLVNSCGKDMPQWMLNDIAIDMRSIDSYMHERNGQWALVPKGQDILDADAGCLFNPITDRAGYDFYQDLLEFKINNMIDSPETVRIGGHSKLFNDMANAYISAVNDISITHFLLVRKKLIRLLMTLSLEYRDHTQYISTVKLLILDCDEKNLEKYIKKYGEATKHISSDDIKDIQRVVNGIIDKRKQILAQALVLESFAYYYDDNTFSVIIEQFLSDAKEAIKNAENYVIPHIISALAGIERRVATERIFELIYVIFDHKYKRWYEDVYKCIKKISTLTELNDREKQRLVSFIKKCLSNKECRENCPSLLDAAQYVRLSLLDRAETLDAVMAKYAPKYYEHPYSVNVFQHTVAEINDYIIEFIGSQRDQNKAQGVGGAYSANAYNDFITIGNIIVDSNESDIKPNVIRRLVALIDETIRLRTQTCEAKFFAIRLLIVLHLLYPKRNDICSVIKEIENNDIIKDSYEFMFQNRYTGQSLLVMCELARVFILGEDSDTFITELYACDVAEQIAVADSLCFLSNPQNYNDSAVLKKIWPVLLQFENSDSERLRFLTSVVYSNLYGSPYEEKALNRLISMMDSGTSSMKIGAISRLKKRNATGALVEFIYQQCRVDNHYCVREIAGR